VNVCTRNRFAPLPVGALQRALCEAHRGGVELLRSPVGHLQRVKMDSGAAASIGLLQVAIRLHASRDNDLAIAFVVVFDRCNYRRLDRHTDGGLQARHQPAAIGRMSPAISFERRGFGGQGCRTDCCFGTGVPHEN
jgi:hypothetical protein